uniref:Neurotransmitter-gated ion-channel ligand-binding domain-containing protein n=1 Tax=Meloidogyne incognita TaxID=6306 RepID=A0A914LTF2_MELIC
MLNYRAFFRRNSRHLRRLSRLYDWEVDEFGSFRPVIPTTQNQRFLRQIKGENEEKLEIKINNQQQQQICANDSYILDKLLINYNRHKIPGGKVEVMVEVVYLVMHLFENIRVWVQEITTISDITSDFQLDIYISEMWRDQALDYSWMEPCKYNLSLNSILLEKLWTPNSVKIIYFNNYFYKKLFTKNIYIYLHTNYIEKTKSLSLPFLFFS